MVTDFLEEVKIRNLYFDNHCSDLYVYITDETTQLVNDYQYKCNVTEFRSQTDGKMMYDISFAYTDYYKRGSK